MLILQGEKTNSYNLPKSLLKYRLHGNQLTNNSSHPKWKQTRNELVKKYDAVELVKIASEILGGKGGGGRKDFAQAGGSNKDKIEDALKTLSDKIT